ncbi:MAG: MFS transporter [Candidatus Limnocylindrales bacterium]
MPTSGRPWLPILIVFWLTSMVEGLGVSQVFALLPSQLSELGVPDADRLSFIGLFSALLFVLGMPLVPLWGVWADKYSRKAVIVRSAIVEAVVFLGMALATEPWHVAVSILLIGFQLGNTGVMLAGIRDVAPKARLGTVIAIFGASGPVGFALGPTLAGIFIDGLGWSISGVFAVSAGLSVGTALLVAFGSREVRPEIIPEGRVLKLAFGALRGVLSDHAVRGIFLIFGVSFLASQMARPYIPVVVETITGRGPGLASGIALVAGTAALAGALLSPAIGALGDRLGYRPILIGALLVGAVALAAMPFVPHVGGLALLAGVAVVFAASVASVSAMVFSMLATEVPPARRSQTLNLVYLPLYTAGILGPLIGSQVVSAGLPAPFLVGAAVFVAGSVVLSRRRPVDQPGRSRSAGPV